MKAPKSPRSSSRSKSSARWLQEHFDDVYVKRAQQEGYRSRASYKLLELQGKDRFLKPGMTVLDLGAAPGGWSQVAVQQVGRQGRVIASDILPMDALAEVVFVQGDFAGDAVFQHLLERTGGAVDVVLSDMAPNLSGTDAVDQPRAMSLAELAADMADRVLKPGGTFVCKIFQGEGFDAFVSALRKKYQTLKIRKPPASRARSREVYLVATGHRKH